MMHKQTVSLRIGATDFAGRSLASKKFCPGGCQEMRHETGPQICSVCHAVSAFAVLKKVLCGRNVFSVLWIMVIMEFSSLKGPEVPL